MCPPMPVIFLRGAQKKSMCGVADERGRGRVARDDWTSIILGCRGHCDVVEGGARVR